MFQNFVQNVPVALRALSEVDLDLDELKENGKGKKKRSKPAEAVGQA